MSVMSWRRNAANARFAAPGSAARVAVSPSSDPIAATEAEAVAAGPDTADQHEDRRDDADDDGQPKRHAEPVHKGRQQDGDEDSDHGCGVPSPTLRYSPRAPSVSRAWPSVIAAATSTTVRLLERAWARMRSKALRSPI